VRHRFAASLVLRYSFRERENASARRHAQLESLHRLPDPERIPLTISVFGDTANAVPFSAKIPFAPTSPASRFSLRHAYRGNVVQPAAFLHARRIYLRNVDATRCTARYANSRPSTRSCFQSPERAKFQFRANFSTPSTTSISHADRFVNTRSSAPSAKLPPLDVKSRSRSHFFLVHFLVAT